VVPLPPLLAILGKQPPPAGVTSRRQGDGSMRDVTVVGGGIAGLSATPSFGHGSDTTAS